jgi:ABC-2 type transport system permease protein
MTGARSLVWFARHEARLSWRDALSMMTAGRPGREKQVAVWLIAFVIGVHGVAYLLIRNFVPEAIVADRTSLIGVTATILLSGSAMLSQAMESVTRTFYARSDLELILSAPVKADKLFAVRIASMALSASGMSVLLMGPFIDVMIWRDGWRWLGAYGVLLALSLISSGLAVIMTIKLFQAIGPRRTRIAAQIAAAIVGGVFVIGLQTAAMFSSGTLSRLAFLRSDTILTYAPDEDSLFWWPARAVLGDGLALAAVLALSAALFLDITLGYAPRVAGLVLAATSTARLSHAVQKSDRFRVATRAGSLRRKERVLLLRDPWLISQTLMQLLYLSPPALLLWHNYGQAGGAVVLVPVLIMAAGQLGGGLAWLTISGEDAPDLVLSAPVKPTHLLRAKAEAVMQCIALIFVTFVAALALASPFQALVAAAGIAAAALSSIAIQLWFRAQARRNQFRRRHTSSRIATLAEALISITWAAAGGVAINGNKSWLAVAGFALFLLWCVRRLSPARAR